MNLRIRSSCRQALNGKRETGPGSTRLTRATIPRRTRTHAGPARFSVHAGRRLEPLLGSAQLRIVHCVVDADVARGRIVQRARDNPLRRAHADPHGIPGLPSASASTARRENKVHEPKACEPASSLSAQVNAPVNAPANASGNGARATRAPIDGAGGTRTPTNMPGCLGLVAPRPR
jgi:hypothetical protein